MKGVNRPGSQAEMTGFVSGHDQRSPSTSAEKLGALSDVLNQRVDNDGPANVCFLQPIG